MSTPIDATVFGVASLRRTLPCVALALVALFVALRPEASAGLGLLARVGFWSLHVAIGFGGLAVASVIARRPPCTRLPLPLSLLLTGLLGALAAGPAFWVAEHWWPVPAGEAPDDWLDAFAAAGVWQGMLAEALEVAPAFVTCWLAVNLPLILARAGPAPSPPADPPPEPPPASGASRGARRSAPATGPPLPECLERLPAAVGRDLVAISSDLHYLHVHTTRGRAMILGNLGDAAAALGDLGMRVHRSHWVAHAHVRRVQIAGNKAWCLLSTGLRVPVSRRKRRETRDQYGQGPVAADAAIGSRQGVA